MESPHAEITRQMLEDYQKGDLVRVKGGPFENLEGRVEECIEATGLVRVTINVHGRHVTVDLQRPKLQPVCDERPEIGVGDIVRIVRGPLEGSVGVVRAVYGG